MALVRTVSEISLLELVAMSPSEEASFAIRDIDRDGDSDFLYIAYQMVSFGTMFSLPFDAGRIRFRITDVTAERISVSDLDNDDDMDVLLVAHEEKIVWYVNNARWDVRASPCCSHEEPRRDSRNQSSYCRGRL